MFKENDLVVYPGCGIGKIIRIEEKEIAGTKVLSYVCKLLDRNTEFIIPQHSVNKVKLRPIISKSSVPQVFKILQEPKKVCFNGSWNKRYKEYTERLRSGDIFELASLLRELYEISKKKPLSFGERKLFEQAKNLLIAEISLATGRSEKELDKEIDEILKT